MLSDERIRPGISNGFLEREGVRQVDRDEAHTLLGFRASGLAIPYFLFTTGKALEVKGKAYFRIRIDRVHGTNGVRYLSPAGSGAQLYIPSTPAFSTPELVICEGEFKALALCEAGIRAVAIGGISSACHDGRLIDGLERLLKRYPVTTLCFLGDADTALNFDFARESVKLARAASSVGAGARVLLPRIDWGLPKGIDDCREAYHFGEPKGDFLGFWNAIRSGALEVDPDKEASALALKLAGTALGRIATSPEDEKQDALRRLVELGSQLDPMDFDTLAHALRDKLGVTLSAFRTAVTQRIRERAAEQRAEQQATLSETLAKAKASGIEIYMHKKSYVARNDEGKYCEVGEPQLVRDLAEKGFDDREISLLLVHAFNHRQIDMHAALAGHKAGVQTNNGERVLVTSDPPIAPCASNAGMFPMISKILDNMLGENQLRYFYTWLQCARQRILDQQWRALQSIVLAGDPNAGKTLVAREIVARALGRCASAFDYMSEKTSFNEDLASAELLLMDDERSASLDRKSQNAISDFLKVVAVREMHRVAPKGQKALHLMLTTTCLICVNLEAKNLKIVPQGYENDMRSRVHVFKCDVHEMPMPTSTGAEQSAFRACLREELPFFLHFIDKQWQIPVELLDPQKRFPCVAFQHPDVVEKVVENSELVEFREQVRESLAIVSGFEDETGAIWMSATQLKRECNLKEKMGISQIGMLLTAWQKEFPEEIRQRRSGSRGRKWGIVLTA